MDYIIEENGKYALYFYHKTDGISRCYIRNNQKQERKSIYKDGTEVFGLFSDGIRVHIVTVSKTGELMYITGSGNDRHKYILKKLHQDENILKIELYADRSVLNMLYTLRTNGKIMLLSCALCNNSTPCIISSCQSADFNLISNRVYFTASDHDAYFCELNHKSPGLPVKIAESSSVPYVFANHIVFISGGKIFFDFKELCRDDNARDVILSENGNKLFAIWKSDDSIRYINTDMTEQTPHTIITPSAKSALYTVFSSCKRFYVYGNSSDTDIITYVSASVFSPGYYNNIQDSVKDKLEAMKKEIELLRNQLAAFSGMLS